jgi:hypothetical protein
MRYNHLVFNYQILLLWIELCLPKIHILNSSPPISQNVILFGNRVIAGVITIKSSWGCDLNATCMSSKHETLGSNLNMTKDKSMERVMVQVKLIMVHCKYRWKSHPLYN